MKHPAPGCHSDKLPDSNMPSSLCSSLYSDGGIEIQSIQWRDSREATFESSPRNGRMLVDLFFNLSGKGCVSGVGREFDTVRGYSWILFPDLGHVLRVKEWCECVRIRLSVSCSAGSSLRRLFASDSQLEPIAIECGGGESRLENLIRASISCGNGVVQRKELVNILRAWFSAPWFPNGETPQLYASRILAENNAKKMCRKARCYMEQNFSKQMSIDDIADHVFISSRHLTRLFNAEYSTTPAKLFLEIRLNNAKKVFETEKESRIKEVAYDCGFTSPSYFALCYRRFFGNLPSDELVNR